MRQYRLGSVRPSEARIQNYVQRLEEGVRLQYVSYRLPHNQQLSPSIVVMHGLAQSLSSWRRVARHLCSKGPRRVISLNARNHGASPRTEGNTALNMASDVLTLMRRMGLTRIVALGHGMGGRAMMTLALVQPCLVDRLIVVDVTTGPVPDDWYFSRERFEMMTQIGPTIPGHLTLNQGRLFVLKKVKHNMKDYRNIVTILQNLRKPNENSFAWSLNTKAVLNSWNDLVTHYEDTLKGLKPYTGKVLLIGGSQSRFVTSSTIDIMKKYFPNTTVKYLDTGPQVFAEQPNKFDQLVADFTR
uniref:sn-1-specific diacylglycerol lipase ABHD11 n=1 Tax=Drosophila phaeopleura TaxID=195712 RepID=D1GZ19_9MUSC|nr:CG14717-PA [Drosophila phaeopleura]